MYARLRIAIFLGSVHELALTRFIVCLRRQFVHYVINSQPPRFRALLSAYADKTFVNGHILFFMISKENDKLLTPPLT